MQGHDIDRTKMDWGYEMDCPQCGERFSSKRSDATFCSPKCRKASQREIERWNTWIDELDYKGEELVNVAKKFKTSKRMYASFLKLQRSLKIAIEEFEDV
jgi:endogenous inhibitor of DNA gyrase (YacG/DUF329 family)